MKMQIDTDKKTVKIESDVSLSELFNTLKKLFPNNEWKDFTLVSSSTITYWREPLIIREIERERWPTPWQPWYSTRLANKNTGDTQKTQSLKSGIYNVEI